MSTNMARSRWFKPGVMLAGYAATILAVALIWALVTEAGWISAQTLPKVTNVVDALDTLSAQGALWPNVEHTGFRILLSFTAGLLLGIPFGGLLWLFPTMGKITKPYLVVSYAVPTVVFYPFFLVVFGINDWPVVVLTAVIAMIPICLNTYIGLQSVPKVLINVARGLERTPAKTFMQVLLPAAWPNILAGMRLSMVYAVASVVSLEFVAAQSGIGNRVQYYYETFDVDSMYAYIILTFVLSGVAVGLIFFLEILTMRGRR